MRFITEFDVKDIAEANRDRFVKTYKSRCDLEIGAYISEAFGWQNPINGDKEHYRLEIEAFPMDKWIEFKVNIIKQLNSLNGIINPLQFMTLLEELESFGKPAGAAKEL